MTVEADPTLHVMTRDLRNIPVPIMLPTLTAMAGQSPSPRLRLRDSFIGICRGHFIGS
jgi:hypothetical protein